MAVLRTKPRGQYSRSYTKGRAYIYTDHKAREVSIRTLTGTNVQILAANTGLTHIQNRIKALPYLILEQSVFTVPNAVIHDTVVEVGAHRFLVSGHYDATGPVNGALKKVAPGFDWRGELSIVALGRVIPYLSAVRPALAFLAINSLINALPDSTACVSLQMPCHLYTGTVRHRRYKKDENEGKNGRNITGIPWIGYCLRSAKRREPVNVLKRSRAGRGTARPSRRGQRIGLGVTATNTPAQTTNACERLWTYLVQALDRKGACDVGRLGTKRSRSQPYRLNQRRPRTDRPTQPQPGPTDVSEDLYLRGISKSGIILRKAVDLGGQRVTCDDRGRLSTDGIASYNSTDHGWM
ncbi:hypothetical protein B0H11DRAFT_1945605 [Mycena galericulata]|nr:hypothetical protein B0H11DRAFT_1945605 [Mycena galericulata]